MLCAKKTLHEFFLINPHLLKAVTEGYPAHNASHVEVWEQLFFFVFKEFPLTGDIVPAGLTQPRPGSTDSRWDTLILKSGYGFMEAMNTLIAEHVRASFVLTEAA